MYQTRVANISTGIFLLLNDALRSERSVEVDSKDIKNDQRYMHRRKINFVMLVDLMDSLHV